MIWAITSPDRAHEEVARINRLLSVADVLLLRKPGWNTDAYAVLLEQLDPAFRGKIMIHEQVSLVREYGLRGLHISEYTRNNGSAERYAAPGVPLSTSIHAPHSPGAMWTHLLLGPVFNSISKPGYAGQAAHMQHVPHNALAIGGVDASHIPAVYAMGFSGAAVLGALWQTEEDIAAVYLKIKRVWEQVAV